MKTPPHRYRPVDVEFGLLKSRIDTAKFGGTYRPKIRRFLKGHKDAEVDRQTIDFLKVFIEWKERRAIRAGNHLKEFTQAERDAAKNAFLWLAQRMQPELKAAEHEKIANINLVKCRKTTREDIMEFIGNRREWNEETKIRLFGRVSMFLDTIDHANTKRQIPGEMLRYLGLTFQDKVLLSPMWNNEVQFSATAVHELGHKHYNLGEPLCYALGTFYSLSRGTITAEKIKDDLRAKNPNNPEGYLEGLAIVDEAIGHGPYMDRHFWENVRQLSIQKQHQWLPKLPRAKARGVSDIQR